MKIVDTNGPVLVKLDRGGELPCYEIFAFGFGAHGVGWMEQHQRSWQLVAWLPVHEIEATITNGSTGDEP